ncbi:restriction endonuclease subunit S, partial [uncultured Methanosphaera sp.]|uniref:restriction endonuclease subunit S n=1 Tax=uncultured Methanosphaera sp. TaxID=262501 RepID=UPI0025FE7A45
MSFKLSIDKFEEELSNKSPIFLIDHSSLYFVNLKFYSYSLTSTSIALILRFPEFNCEWDEKYFGDLFSIKNGLNKGKDYFGHGTPILNYMDVNQNVYNSEDNVKGCVEVTPEEIDKYGVNNNDLFLTRTSETSDEIGLTSTYQGNNSETVFSGFILRARPYKLNIIDSLFYAYYLRTSNMRNNIIKYSSITTRALINSSNLSKIKVKLPSIEEQEKIASFLLDIDQKIELLHDKKEEFIEFKHYLLQNLFPQNGKTAPILRF